MGRDWVRIQSTWVMQETSPKEVRSRRVFLRRNRRTRGPEVGDFPVKIGGVVPCPNHPQEPLVPHRSCGPPSAGTPLFERGVGHGSIVGGGVTGRRTEEVGGEEGDVG